MPFPGILLDFLGNAPSPWPTPPNGGSRPAASVSAEHRPADALAAYDAAVMLRPGYAPAHLGRAHALRDLGRNAEAEAAVREADRLDPRLAVRPQRPDA